jgi:methionyl-tRNA synthetase
VPSATSPLAEIATQSVAQTIAEWKNVQPGRALDATWSLIRATNAYLETNEPWKMEPGKDLDLVMGDALEALRIVTILASVAMPATTQDVWQRLGMSGQVSDQRVGTDTQWGRYPGGTTVTKGEPLFPRKKI